MTVEENIAAILKYPAYMDLSNETDISNESVCEELFDDECVGCPFDTSPDICSALHEYNPSLTSAIEELRITHPELFI